MSAKVFVPPAWPSTDDLHEADNDCLFLAGTIEMGNSPDWQADVIEIVKDYDIIVFNPRRVLPPEGTEDIIKQINWELSGLHKSNTVYMHLCANTISPISLLELGLLQGTQSTTKVIVYCDPEYLRMLNVVTTTNHPLWVNPFIRVFDDYEKSIISLKKRLDIVTSMQNF